MLLPVPMLEPPQLDAYHTHCAPVPSEPPTTDSVVFPPLQIAKMPPTLLGAVEGALTVTVVWTQAVLLHPVPLPGS